MKPSEEMQSGRSSASEHAAVAAFLVRRSYMNAAFELAIEFAREGIDVPELRRLFPGQTPLPVKRADRSSERVSADGQPLLRIIVAGSSEYAQLLLEKERQLTEKEKQLIEAREDVMAARELAREVSASREQAAPSAFRRLSGLQAVASVDLPRTAPESSPGTPKSARGMVPSGPITPSAGANPYASPPRRLPSASGSTPAYGGTEREERQLCDLLLAFFLQASGCRLALATFLDEAGPTGVREPAPDSKLLAGLAKRYLRHRGYALSAITLSEELADGPDRPDAPAAAPRASSRRGVLFPDGSPPAPVMPLLPAPEAPPAAPQRPGGVRVATSAPESDAVVRALQQRLAAHEAAFAALRAEADRLRGEAAVAGALRAELERARGEGERLRAQALSAASDHAGEIQALQAALAHARSAAASASASAAQASERARESEAAREEAGRLARRLEAEAGSRARMLRTLADAAPAIAHALPFPKRELALPVLGALAAEHPEPPGRAAGLHAALALFPRPDGEQLRALAAFPASPVPAPRPRSSPRVQSHRGRARTEAPPAPCVRYYDMDQIQLAFVSNFLRKREAVQRGLQLGRGGKSHPIQLQAWPLSRSARDPHRNPSHAVAHTVACLKLKEMH